MINWLQLKWNLFKTKFFGEENGAVDLVVIVILIAVVVVLALIFKDNLIELIEKIFGDLEDKTNDLMATPIPKE